MATMKNYAEHTSLFVQLEPVGGFETDICGMVTHSTGIQVLNIQVLKLVQVLVYRVINPMKALPAHLQKGDTQMH